MFDDRLSNEVSIMERGVDNNRNGNVNFLTVDDESKDNLYANIRSVNDKNLITGLTEEDTVNVQRKDLKEIPTFREEHRTIKNLYLDYNLVKRISESVFHTLKGLVILSVIGNDLEHLPTCIGELRNLCELYLNENNLISLPSSLPQLTKLKRLNIVGNMIKSLPQNFGALCSLQQLDADENLLQEIPDSFGDLSQLQVLELANNKLLDIPAAFGKLSSLHTLNLSGNNLTNLPESFEDLAGIRMLDLSENSLQTLPERFSSDLVLEKFYFSENYITWWPNWMGNMPCLEELIADDNRLTGFIIPEEFGYNCQNLRVLHLAGNYMNVLPDSFGRLQNLESLHLGSCIDELERRAFQNGNQLQTLPDSFCQLTKLHYLRLDENKLVSLPEDLGNLVNLDYIDLGQNHLHQLPDSICHLHRLRICKLSRNLMQTLPERIDMMTGLRELHLDNNLVNILPNSLGELTKLESLDLFNNKLTVVPPFLNKLVGLKQLDLQENNFKLKLKDIPKVWSGINYPTRDPNLKDNWRGQVRHNNENYESRIIIEADEDIEQEPDEEPKYTEHQLELAVRRNLSLWRSHTGPSKREKFERTSDQLLSPLLPPIDLTESGNSVGSNDWVVSDDPVKHLSTEDTKTSSWGSDMRFGEENWVEDLDISQCGKARLDDVALESKENPWQEEEEEDIWTADIQVMPPDDGDLMYKFVPCEIHPADIQKADLSDKRPPEEGQFDDADEPD